jgi:hypothetical protein
VKKGRYNAGVLKESFIPGQLVMLLFTIWGSEKEPTLDETEAITLHPDLDEALQRAQALHEKAYSITMQDFLDYPIDPTVLEEERIRWNCLVLVVRVERGEVEGSDIKSVVESVAFYNSIIYNADFIQIR